MGNFLNRRRDPSANSAKPAATEQKTAEEPTASQPAQESGAKQTQEAVKTENLDAVAGGPVTVAASLPTEAYASECTEVKAPAAPLNAEPESVAKETSAPDQPLVSVSETSPSEPEPKPVAEAQLAPEPAPEVVPEPEPTSNPEAEVVPEPVSESVPAPAEALEQQADMLTQESLPEPVVSSPALIDLGVPDATPQPIDTPPIPAPVDADEPSDIPAVTEECQDSAEVPVTSTLELEMSEETSESLEKSMEVEAAGTLEQLVSDVNEESVSELLQNLELKGNDLVADLIPTDVKIPDDSPITDMSTSTELM